jgi:hypothetical protein
VQVLPVRPIQEQRLLAGLRHDHRLAALDDAARDPFADPVAGPLAVRWHPVPGDDLQLLGILSQQRHGTANHAVLAVERFEDATQPGPKLGRRGQQLIDLEQGRERCRFECIVSHEMTRRQLTFEYSVVWR